MNFYPKYQNKDDMKKENRGGPRVAGPGKKMGRPALVEKKQFQIRIPVDLATRVQNTCFETGKTQTEFMESAILAYLDLLKSQ